MKITMRASGLAALGLAVCLTSQAYGANTDKKKDGGLIGNSYASEMLQIDATTLRITSRKRISGTLDEINTPGTTAYKALQAIQAATTVRAALESNNLGSRYFEVTGAQNKSRTIEQAHVTAGQNLSSTTSSASAGEHSATSSSANPTLNDFSFAPGHYNDEVELVLEVTVKLLGTPAADAQPPANAVDAQQILTAYGIKQ